MPHCAQQAWWVTGSLKAVLYTPVIAVYKKKWEVGREWGFRPRPPPLYPPLRGEEGELDYGVLRDMILLVGNP